MYIGGVDKIGTKRIIATKSNAQRKMVKASDTPCTSRDESTDTQGNNSSSIVMFFFVLLNKHYV